MNFISTAHAATGLTQTPPPGSDIISPLVLFLFIGIFYFFLLRPQNKRHKEHKQLIEALQKGDEVVTNGGMLGKISKIKDDFITVTIAEGVDIKCQRAAVSTVLPKGTLKSVG